MQHPPDQRLRPPVPVPSPLVSTLHRLWEVLRREDLAQLEALVRLSLAGGLTFPELCDRQLRPALAAMERHGTPSEVRRAIQCMTALLSRLRTPRPGPGRGRIAVLVPSGSADFVDASFLAVALEMEGWTLSFYGAMVIEDFLDTEPPSAVLVGQSSAVRGFLKQLRPLLPSTAVICFDDMPGADLVVETIKQAVVDVHRLAASLSELDLAVLNEVASGSTNKEIARRLELAPSTVKSRLDRLFVKLDVPDRAAAAAVAVRHGWIS